MQKPFSLEEQKVMDALVEAWKGYVELKSTHPSHDTDFANAIHAAQDVLIHRIVQRDYLDTFPTYDSENKDVPN